jgi:hypothetical protein
MIIFFLIIIFGSAQKYLGGSGIYTEDEPGPDIKICLEEMLGTRNNTCYVAGNYSGQFGNISVNVNDSYILESVNTNKYKLTMNGDFTFTISKIYEIKYLEVL